MVRTILPKKATFETPITTDDSVESQLINDPSVPQFKNSEQANLYQGFISQANPFIQNQPVMPIVTAPTTVLTQPSETNSASNAEVLVKNTNEDFINKKWRPAMAWSYMITCITDFVLFPVLWSILQSISHGQVSSQWQPLTLQGAGLYHLAMGAVLGIAAYGRTKEKLENKN